MSKYFIMATWDDAPHITAEMKAEYLKEIPPCQRDARSKGIPSLGSGVIYPVPESEVLVADMPIPDHWTRFYAMDVGWEWTAAAHFAHDKDSDTLYIYRTYKRSQAEPSVHAEAIKAPGDWVPGVIDPASAGSSQRDGVSLMENYRALGLILTPANNGVESGILTTWQRLSSGKLKVFRSCQDWLAEFRVYRRDEKGRIVKKNDHLMDCTRYGVMSGHEVEKVKREPVQTHRNRYAASGTGWMG